MDACLQGASVEKRWLVLETPHPEERMVAAALISTGNVPGTVSQTAMLSKKQLCFFRKIEARPWRGTAIDFIGGSASAKSRVGFCAAMQEED